MTEWLVISLVIAMPFLGMALFSYVENIVKKKRANYLKDDELVISALRPKSLKKKDA